ncbi:MAG: OmpA family protein [Leptolyngbyaceae cyanobacterium]
MPELPPFNNPPPKPEVIPAGETVLQPPAIATAPIKEPPPPARWQGARSLSLWILRWALLGAGIGGAWLFGILVAQFFPAPNPGPPTQEIVTRRTSRFFQKVVRLPDWWAGDALNDGGASTKPQTPQTPSAPATPTPTTQPIALTDAQREQVEVELEAIETDLQQLQDRASAIERQLGLPNIAIALEERLNNATSRLTPATETTQPAPPTAPALQPTQGEVPDPLFQVNALRVTLPSDVLFPPADAILQTNARPLLDSILQDVGRYPEATIIVGSYTDTETEDSTATELSYQQALAVQRYLSQRLGENTIHWVPVGYGNSAIGSTGGLQLSRRVTIAIVP